MLAWNPKKVGLKVGFSLVIEVDTFIEMEIIYKEDIRDPKHGPKVLYIFL